MQAQIFLDHIYAAFFEQTNAKRQQSEQILLSLKDSNPEELLRLCSNGFANQSLKLPTRQACATLLKRCLGLIHPQRQDQTIWTLCSLQARRDIKATCVDQLVNEEFEIRRSAANAISEICAIELPRKEWPDLIPNLVTNTKNEQMQIRISAVMTLGYICEALKNHQQSGIQIQDAQTILMGICVGMDQNETNLDIKLTALKALQDSLYFLNELFQQIEIRNYVVNLLFINTTSQIAEIKIKTLQCLIDFTKQLFMYIPQYLNELFQCTSVSFEADESIAIPAIEIWNTLSNEIKEIRENQGQNIALDQVCNLCTNFLISNSQGFTIPFLKNLLINNTNDDDEDDDETGGLSIQQSSYKGLALVIELVGVATHEQVTTFISNTIKSPQWQFRKAGVLAFGALAEGSNIAEVRNLIFSAITTLLETLADQNHRVKKAASLSLSKIAENYPECFLQHSQSLQILQQLHLQLTAKIKLATNIVWTLTYITEHLGRFPQSPVNQEKLSILQHLSSTSIRQDIKDNQVNIIDTAFMGILNVIYLYNDQNICKQLLMEFLKQIQTLDQYHPEMRKHLQAGLLSAMHGCLVKMQSENLSDKEIQHTFTILSTACPNGSSDQFYALAGFATCLKKKFLPFCDLTINLLNKPLQESEDQETFKSALFCLADIARSIEDDFTPYLPILEYMFNLITDPNFNRDLKIQVYNTIADIIIGVKERSLQYLNQIKQILQFGFAACINLSKSNDSASQDYAERLKEALVSFYTCLLHAFSDTQNPFTPLNETIDWIFIFCEQMCDKKLRPTTEFARSVLNVIFDVANFYYNSQNHQKQIQSFVTGPFVIDLIKTLNKYKKDKEIGDAVKYACDLLRQKFDYNLQIA